MFSLVSGFIHWVLSKPEVNVLMVGLDHAGKTTLLEQTKGLYTKAAGIPPEKIPPTVGMNIAKLDIDGARVVFWDVGGQSALRSIWDKYYDSAHAVLFVVDACDRDRFAEARGALETMMSHDLLADTPVLLLANKSDRSDAVRPVALQAEVAGCLEMSFRGRSSRPARAMPASGLTCTGVKDAMSWIVAQAKASPRLHDA